MQQKEINIDVATTNTQLFDFSTNKTRKMSIKIIFKNNAFTW